MVGQDQAFRYHQRAITLLQLEKFDQAAREAQRALEQNPDDGEAHRLLAFAFLGQKRLAEAETEARIAVRLAPDYPYAHNALAQVLDKRKQSKEAWAHYEQAIALEPSEPDFHVTYADFLYRDTKLDKASFHIETALQLEPRDATAHLLRGSCFLEREPQEAESAFRQALAIAPNNYRAHVLLGELYLRVHDDGDRAEDCFREALRLNPNSEFAKTELIRIWNARLPILGVFWRFGRTRWTHRLSWVIIMSLLLAWCCLSEWAASEMVLVYGVCFGLALLWGAFVWLADSLITHAVTKGWIK